MRHRSKPEFRTERTLESDPVESLPDRLLHSTLLTSVKSQLSQLVDETVDAYARLDLAEGRRTSSAICEALARLETGALEALALVREESQHRHS